MRKDPIAIIGLGCRLPGANNPQEFWQLLCEGVDVICEVPASRWDLEEYFDSNPLEPHKMSTRWGGFLEQVDQFDPLFFGIAPREINSMDPQQRLILETTWEALEDAGQVPQKLSGSKTGVFIGVSSHDYSSLVTSDDPYSLTGNTNCIVPNRVSYLFNLKGPSLAIDTACSSSLVAIHLACQSLRNGESTMAIAGGVQVILSADLTVTFNKAGLLSPDGRCRSFDAKANGYVRSEGAGVVVLKPLAQAQADGDPIYAVILGSAVNQDGRSNGLSAPNPDAQEEVIRTAYQQAEVTPAQIQYVEAHGTGTKIGDPLELKALGAVLAENRDLNNRCAVGSVKTNVGHSETAAGITGLMKVALALKHQQIPPSLHFDEPNPYIDFKTLPLQVQTTLEPWPQADVPALAGVSSFGFGGTNAHVVLQEAPVQSQSLAFSFSEVQRPLHLLTLTAKTEVALRELAQRYQSLLHNQPMLNLADLCYSANTRRSHFAQRLVLWANSNEEMRTQLQAWLADEPEQDQVLQGCTTAKTEPRVVFLFTGQGSQYWGMGRQLYKTQPYFREILDRCNQILLPYLQPSLLDVLFGEHEDQSLIDETVYTQPALFALEYALAKLWMSWGIQPSVVLGHSVGEYVAACIAGVFSLEDGLKLIATRGRLMQALPKTGSMLAVLADEETVTAQIQGTGVSIATLNGPRNFVLSGARDAIAQVAAHFEAQEIKTKLLKVSHAFHSPLMDPMLSEFAQVASEITYSRPTISLISNLTGAAIVAEIATPEYWCLHIRQPVNFAASMKNLERQGEKVFLEVGPKPVLLGMGRTCFDNDDCSWLPSLRPPFDDWQQIFQSLGHLYLKGVEVDWKGFDQVYARRPVTLPTYPFQRQRYWWSEDDIAWRYKQRGSRSPELRVRHALINPLRSADNATDLTFEFKLQGGDQAYLQDHCIMGQPILPATAYLEAILEAGDLLLEAGQLLQIQDIAIEQPFRLNPEYEASLELRLDPIPDAVYQFEIVSVARSSPGDVSRHAKGQIKVIASSDVPKGEPLAQIQSHCDRPLPADLYYRQLAQLGLEYGPAFQGIQEIWQGAQQALGQVVLPKSLTSEKYTFHPALLDACFQVLGAAIEPSRGAVAHLPIGIERMECFAAIPSQVWSHVQIQDQPEKYLKAQVDLYDLNGQLIAQVQGLTLRAVGRSMLRRLFLSTTDLESWFYQSRWLPQPLSAEVLDRTDSWLIFKDEQGLAQVLGEALVAKGDRVVWVSWAQSFGQISADQFQVNPHQPDSFVQLLESVSSLMGDPITGILHFWSQSSQVSAEPDMRACETVLSLVQAIAQNKTLRPRLWLMTAGAQGLENPSTPVQAHQIEQAALWGLGRTIAFEYPELQCTRVDLDAGVTPTSLPLEQLLQEFKTQSPEDQLRYHQGDRYGARLERLTSTPSANGLQRPDSESFQLQISEYGILDRLILAPTDRQSPGVGEVEIEVHASGLNFRDVLNALGMLKAYMEELGFSDASAIPFGGECSGKIVAVGPGVTDFKVGDAVIAANAIGSMARYVVAPALFVVPKPANLSFVEAATLATAFLTAQYALHTCAQIQPGDRILIHSAAGGVGQAAVQLAQQIGAEVYATASPSKWDRLKEMGVKHLYNSRTLDFAQEIWADTEHQGVDVVLNSLNGDYIPKNLSILAPQGRFVEIGKLGIWSSHQVATERPDVSYRVFDLLEVSQQTPQMIRDMLEHLMPAFAKQSLRPLSHQVFPMEDAIAAFRHMAQAKHIGKVVLDLQPTPKETQAPRKVQADGTYLITGGMGALGLQVAQWLMDQGAKHLVLLGRRPASETLESLIDLWDRQGIQVVTAQADVADPSQMADVLDSLRSRLPSFKGVFHTAGILEDAFLAQQTWDSFQRVMAPKVQGSWNLHVLTSKDPLDFFVCFSSIASLLGSPGQGNYAAANAYMDGLAQYRRSLGLPGLSLNWGPWGGGGMAAALSDRDRARLQANGLTPILPHQGLQALEEILLQGDPLFETAQIGVFNLDWGQFLQQFPTPPPFLEKMEATSALGTSKSGSSAFLQQLEQTPVGDRYPLISTHVRTQIAKVLGVGSPDLIELGQSFADLGMDSLMGMEMKSRLQQSFNTTFPITLAADYPTVGRLVDYLAQEVVSLDATSASTQAVEDTAIRHELEPADLSESTQPLDRIMQPLVEVDRLNPEIDLPSDQSLMNGKEETAKVPSPVADLSTLPREFYDFESSPEYQNLQQYLIQGQEIGNPFFTVHDGIAKAETHIDGHRLINFSSYNYLGLAGHPAISKAAKDSIDTYGTSVSASRVVSGERPIHQQLEQAIAQFLGTEDCIVYIGGHTTNVSTIGHLMGKNDLIVCDALSHNSVQLGCQLSGATVLPFAHNDVNELEKILAERRGEFEKALVVIEGVYSTDGDLAPLPQIVALKQKYKAFLMVDEAHSMGVVGKTGRGVAEHFGIDPADVDLWMGTLSKSLASCGGYIAASHAFVEYLKYTSPGFVFSVGMTPSNAAAALAALKKLRAEPERVERLRQQTQMFLDLAKEQGFDTGNSQDSPIVPIIIGDPFQAVRLSRAMMDRGVNVQPMVYPSVPYDAARLRFFLSCDHTEDQIRQTLKVLAEEIAAMREPNSSNDWLHYVMRSQFLTETISKFQS